MSEERLRARIVSDLHKRGVNAISLGGGTFDLVIEGSERPFFFELKIVRAGVRGFKEKMRGIKFSAEQTRNISLMKFPPYVIARDGASYFLLPPDQMKTEVRDRKELGTAIFLKHRDYVEWPRALAYDKLLARIEREIGRG